MERGTDSLLESESATADEDAERCEKRPVETLPPVPEWMGLVRRARTAEYADKQEHLDGYGGTTGCSLGT